MSVSGAILSGASPTVIVTVAVSSPPFPSLIVYVNVSVPLNPASGVYVYVPSSFRTNVPFDGSVFPMIVRSSPSGSESLSNTLPLTAVSYAVVAVSSTASGASLTGGGGGASPTVIVTVAVSSPPFPSLIVYVNVSVPLNPASGVYVYVPSSFRTNVPFDGSVFPMIVRSSPSGSESLSNTLPLTAVSYAVVAVSSTASGA